MVCMWGRSRPDNKLSNVEVLTSAALSVVALVGANDGAIGLTHADACASVGGTIHWRDSRRTSKKDEQDITKSA